MKFVCVYKVMGCLPATMLFVVSTTLGTAASDTLEDAKKEGNIVFYSTMNADHQEILVKGFNKKYPFIKVDSFRGNNSRITSRFLTEASAGRNGVDVIGIDGLNGWVYKEKGLLQPYKSKEAGAFPPGFQDPEGFLICCSYVLTNVIAYNTRRVTKTEAPKTYEDLLLPKWKGRLGMNEDMPESLPVESA
jgi:iron(III) transport system substrate-binding protein